MTDQSPSNSESPSRWIKCISTSGTIRGVAIQATGLAREFAAVHDLKGVSAQGMGEAMIAALLVSSYCKPGERINLNVQGRGLFRQALVDAYPNGAVRGYVVERAVSKPELKYLEDHNLGPWGEGTLSVLRTKGQQHQQPYIGTVPLLTGHLAKDLTFYWAQSEQVPSAVGIVVNLDISGNVFAAGGFLVQAMPGATASEIQMIEKHINEIHSLAHQFATDPDPLILLSRIFQSTAFVLLEDRPLKFECNCSVERVERALALVGVSELESMLAEEGQAVIRCDFCAKEYKINAERLAGMIQGSSQNKKS